MRLAAWRFHFFSAIVLLCEYYFLTWGFALRCSVLVACLLSHSLPMWTYAWGHIVSWTCLILRNVYFGLVFVYSVDWILSTLVVFSVTFVRHLLSLEPECAFVFSWTRFHVPALLGFLLGRLASSVAQYR